MNLTRTPFPSQKHISPLSPRTVNPTPLSIYNTHGRNRFTAATRPSPPSSQASRTRASPPGSSTPPSKRPTLSTRRCWPALPQYVMSLVSHVVCLAVCDSLRDIQRVRHTHTNPTHIHTTTHSSLSLTTHDLHTNEHKQNPSALPPPAPLDPGGVGGSVTKAVRVLIEALKATQVKMHLLDGGRGVGVIGRGGVPCGR